MSYSNVSAVCLLSLFLVSVPAHAKGVFGVKKESNHELSKTEKRNINAEFSNKFGQGKSELQPKSNNPWKAKKERNKQKKSAVIGWSGCRDYALLKRNQCYKEGRLAYHCERYYDARSAKCNKDY